MVFTSQNSKELMIFVFRLEVVRIVESHQPNDSNCFLASRAAAKTLAIRTARTYF